MFTPGNTFGRVFIEISLMRHLKHTTFVVPEFCIQRGIFNLGVVVKTKQIDTQLWRILPKVGHRHTHAQKQTNKNQHAIQEADLLVFDWFQEYTDNTESLQVLDGI